MAVIERSGTVCERILVSVGWRERSARERLHVPCRAEADVTVDALRHAHRAPYCRIFGRSIPPDPGVTEEIQSAGGCGATQIACNVTRRECIMAN
jgi:hypothetical protein